MTVSEILELLELLNSRLPDPIRNTMALISVGSIAAITAASLAMNASNAVRISSNKDKANAASRPATPTSTPQPYTTSCAITGQILPGSEYEDIQEGILEGVYYYSSPSSSLPLSVYLITTTRTGIRRMPHGRFSRWLRQRSHSDGKSVCPFALKMGDGIRLDFQRGGSREG